MFTELLCHGAGGPELPTSRGFDDAKLGVNPDQWEAFMDIVAETAAIWPTKHHRELIIKICEGSKVEMCWGLEGQAVTTSEMDLICPPAVEAFKMTSQCPFSGQAGAKCPFTGAGQPSMATNRSSINPVGTVPSVQSAVLDQPHAQRTNVTSQALMPGRVLGNTLQQRLDKLTLEDPELCCPVSLMPFKNPVMASDGFTYEESSLKQLLANGQSSPMTRELLKKEYRLAEDKKAEVTIFKEKRSQELLDFAAQAITEHPGLALSAAERVTEYLEVLSTEKVPILKTKAAQIYQQLGRSVPA
jgi:hypothetical protein